MTNPSESIEPATSPPCTLAILRGRLHVRRPSDEEPIPAKIVYLRPLSTRTEVAFLDDHAAEILTLYSLEVLQPTCQALAQAELRRRYHLPRIQQVRSIRTIFGTHYWEVITDKGLCAFAFKEPGKNVSYMPPSRIILRDTIGNRYEIPSLEQLDAASRRRVNQIL